MPAVQPLTSSRDIRAVLSARRSAHASAVVLHGRWDAERAAAGLPGRAAVIAGKRVGNAVARNRSKRRLRATLHELGLPDGLDLVAIARATTPAVPYRSLVSQVAQGLERIARSAPHGHAPALRADPVGSAR